MGSTVLITGSSSGIGKETATLFQRKGWNVAASMRRPAQAIDLDRLDHLSIPKLDVTQEKTIEKSIRETIDEFGGIDVVVNNAGYALTGPLEAVTDEQIRKQFETNVFGLVNVMRAMLPHFRERGGGTIVNVASMGGRVAFPLYSLYHGTKWSVEGISESIRHELMPLGIQVKIVEPGPIKTDFYGRSLVAADLEGFEDYAPFVERVTANADKAAQKGASPQQVAAVIFKAATDRSGRLRYKTDWTGRMVLLARRLLTDTLFNGLAGRVLTR